MGLGVEVDNIQPWLNGQALCFSFVQSKRSIGLKNEKVTKLRRKVYLDRNSKSYTSASSIGLFPLFLSDLGGVALTLAAEFHFYSRQLLNDMSFSFAPQNNITNLTTCLFVTINFRVLNFVISTIIMSSSRSFTK